MYTLILAILTFSMTSYAAAEEKSVHSIELMNGQLIQVDKEVKEIFITPKNEIDMIELNEGQIFYDTEIRRVNFHDIRFQLRNDSAVLKMSGDGSGGG